MVKDSSSMGSLTLSRYTRIPPPLWLYYIHRLLIHGLSQSIPVFIATSSMVLYIGCSSMVSNTPSRYTRLPPLWLKTAHPWVHSLFPGIQGYLLCGYIHRLLIHGFTHSFQVYKATSSMVFYIGCSSMGSLILSRYTRLSPLWL